MLQEQTAAFQTMEARQQIMKMVRYARKEESQETNRLKPDKTLNARLSGVTSNIQTQCNTTIKKSGTTALMNDVVLTGVYKFAEPHPLNSVIVVVLHPVYKHNSTIACETITPLLY